MRTCPTVLARALFLAMCFAAPLLAQDNDKAVMKDLTAVIALQGFPCGEVVAATMQGKNDYAASCKDGNKYRVYQNDKGRVVVEKRS